MTGVIFLLTRVMIGGGFDLFVEKTNAAIETFKEAQKSNVKTLELVSKASGGNAFETLIEDFDEVLKTVHEFSVSRKSSTQSHDKKSAARNLDANFSTVKFTPGRKGGGKTESERRRVFVTSGSPARGEAYNVRMVRVQANTPPNTATPLFKAAQKPSPSTPPKEKKDAVHGDLQKLAKKWDKLESAQISFPEAYAALSQLGVTFTYACRNHTFTFYDNEGRKIDILTKDQILKPDLSSPNRRRAKSYNSLVTKLASLLPPIYSGQTGYTFQIRATPSGTTYLLKHSLKLIPPHQH